MPSPGEFALNNDVPPALERRATRHGLRLTAAARRVRMVQRMLATYGPGPAGETCAHCAFLTTREYSGRYYKCLKYGASRSEASDWRKGNPACGAFRKEAK